MVASTGVDRRSTIWAKIRNSPAPSIYADSMMAIGMEVAKKVRMIRTKKPLSSSPGIISPQTESFTLTNWVNTRYHGTRPPLNRMVKKMKKAKGF
ncbi:hypothetical protein D3C75_1086930 [compost metagenome]